MVDTYLTEQWQILDNNKVQSIRVFECFCVCVCGIARLFYSPCIYPAAAVTGVVVAVGAVAIVVTAVAVAIAVAILARCFRRRLFIYLLHRRFAHSFPAFL